VRDICKVFEQDSPSAALARIVFSMFCVLIVWQAVSVFVVNRLLLVPPSEVAAAILAEIRRGSMWTNAQATVTAVGISFAVSVALGIAIGLALASSRFLLMITGPVLSALNSVPIIALAPLFIAWLGLGSASKFVLVLMVARPNVIDAWSAVS
jgi:NitT/TauT family transport system permease protein